MQILEPPKIELLDNIPVRPDISRIRKRLQFHLFAQGYEAEIESVLSSLAESQFRPRAVFKPCRIIRTSPDALTIDNQIFKSTLLLSSLVKGNQVFVYGVNCGGKEDKRREKSSSDNFYLRQVIRETQVAQTEEFLRDFLIKRYELNLLWSLSPGQYQAWPASDRRPLLELLGRDNNLAGISIDSHDDLKPPNSSLGLFYYYQTEFEKCQFCTRVCMGGRRAPYNPELAARFPERAVRGGCAG